MHELYRTVKLSVETAGYCVRWQGPRRVNFHIGVPDQDLDVRPNIVDIWYDDDCVCGGFYRTTRMHTVDYAVARCLFVRHTPVLCLNIYTYPQTFFTVGKPHHFSFSVPNGMAIFSWDPPPPNGGVECMGCMKQEAQLSQRDRATLHVIEYFAKWLEVIRHGTVENQ